MKARFILTAVMEVDIIPENYEPELDTDEKRVAFDIEAMQSDPGLFWEIHDSKGISTQLTGELLK